ncbi:hypothetical protein D8Y22_00535 [Salinadaptatus halalkaliphilus]|uniref:DUF7344 domain-containing protein n=1 Tax=Salinadaptatus halalkaliphilus TaxID=2419781 RepID=A0A4S3TT59_9EURY|nr:hypothetical protein [Salinadaptatus halalkaliphilus]THE66655.1 hypothetical protein D8Y22_00535 [Salinadaptatus halalkaliphilus]
MSQPSAAEESLDVATAALAKSERRHLLAVLSDDVEPVTSPASMDGPVPLETLAIAVASSVYAHPIVTDEQWTNTRDSLEHAHLPLLEDHGLVRRVEREETTIVVLCSHPLLQAGWVQSLLSDPTGGAIEDEDVLDRTLEVLRSSRRRQICHLLARRRDTVSLEDLAVSVAAREGNTGLLEVAETTARTVATDLAHSHLPALADAGLVAYDRPERTAELRTDAPQWRADWLQASPLGDIPEQLGLSSEAPAAADETPSSQAGTCRTIEGTENIVNRGHEIADGTDDELFVTVSDDGFLQQRCLERWKAAADRGVDVFVGSRSPEVREIVREAVPSATVCEPQLDWLNFPADCIHHGRVIFSDRDCVMLVTAEETDPDDRTYATAITGEGETNVLVSLVREQVGPRLDRLKSDHLEADGIDGTRSLPM